MSLIFIWHLGHWCLVPPWKDGRPRLVLAVCLFQDDLEAEWCEDIALALIELGLELHPVKTQGVQEGRQALHDDQDADCEAGPGGEDDVE